MADQHSLIDKFNDLNPIGRWIAVGSAVGAMLILPAGLHYAGMLAQKPPEQTTSTKDGKTATPAPVAPNAVTALGRLEPIGEVIKVSAPSSQGGSAIVEKLDVKEGDKVQKGQIIAILDNRAKLEAAFARATEDVKVAQANLAKVKAGAKSGEIAAQQSQIARLESQLRGDAATYQATKARLEAQLKWEPAAQAGKIRTLTAQLAGEKPAQEATIRRLKAQLKNAELEYQRFQQLYSQNAIAATNLDAKRLAVETARQQLAEAESRYRQTIAMLNQQILENQATKNKIETTTAQQLAEAKANYDKTLATTTQQIQEAKATLNKIAEVRPVDVSQAQAELARAQAAARQAKADLDQAYIKSPIAGEVLKIHARQGESSNNNSGILELGQTNQMVAVAEVYESDISKVKVGQTASISSEAGAFSQSVQGTVSQVGLQIGKQDVLSTDPAANSDSRVVEVKVLIDPTESRTVSSLTNSKVMVKINTGGG
jgi:HlyD family secretion protein